MKLKYVKSLINAELDYNRIAALAWSPNNEKLAVATSERQILLFDEKGERRDKFATKPADPERGKKSYVITQIGFSADSTKIAVAQSDCIVFVYKLGEKWGEKKVICNKFAQSSPITSINWLASGLIICGLFEGKVRALHTKSNKSQSLYGSQSLVTSIVANAKGSAFITGHDDGSIVRFYLEGDNDGHGRVCTHSCPPYALAWVQGHIVAAGCDKRVVIYEHNGKILRVFDYSKVDDEYEFTIACSSPSAQAFIIGSFDHIRLYTWSPREQTWNEGEMKEIKNFYTVTAAAWKRDGCSLVIGGLCGSVEMFESVLRQTIWRDQFEITYVGPSQVLVKPLKSQDGRGVVLKSHLGKEIEDVRIMGNNNYLVARTDDTLLLGDLVKNHLSEVPWNSYGKKEKFYFNNENVCMIFNGGELSLVEYGTNTILGSVRTEFVNPHLISVRLNERAQAFDNKKLAFLLDLKTICVIDLISGVTICQIQHDTKIDWLELSELAHKLLYRDKQQRLFLIDVTTTEKNMILTGVIYVQWVPASDVVIAQTPEHLVIWYNIELYERMSVMPIQGDVFDVIRENGKTQVLTQHGNLTLSYELDEGLVEFGTAVHDNDFSRAVLFLETIDGRAEADAMWHNLATIALAQNNLEIAERCFAALNDICKAQFLRETMKKAEQDKSLDIWARLAMFNGDLRTAENVYVENGEIESAINMFVGLNKWDEAINMAEIRAYPHLDDLKNRYSKYLIENNQEEKLAVMLEEQNVEKAVEIYLKCNRSSKAAKLMLNNDFLLDNEPLVNSVTKQLLKNDLFEQAAELYGKLGQDQLALKYYRLGHNYSKALEKCREIAPDQILALEEQWGDYLVSIKQLDAAVNHYIEANKTLKALEAAIDAKQWLKAVQIIMVFDDPEPVKKYYQQLAGHFESTKEYDVAESLLVKSRMYNEAVEMYNRCKKWEKAHALATKYLETSVVTAMYVQRAEDLQREGKFRDAEKLYLSVGESDMAIAMYRKHDQYDNMVRLVERFHPHLLQTTHLHLGQKLEEQRKFKSAEGHYLASGEWRAAVNMYRANHLWEEAYRVAKQNGGPLAGQQIAFIWARTLPLESAIKLLTKLDILETCIDYACQTLQFEFAFNLCKKLPNKIADVHYKYAMQLEDDGKFKEAELEFISADKSREAVLMYMHNRDWSSAQRVAESHAPQMIDEVLVGQASECFNAKDFTKYEMLLLRAQKAELIIQQYKDTGMWVDALRICREYRPNLLQALQAEYHRNVNKTEASPGDVTALFKQASDWVRTGDYKQAIGCYLRVNSSNADAGAVSQALLQAADVTNRFLDGANAVDVINILGPRLNEINEHTVASQLYLSADMIKEAIDSFILGDDWSKARKIAQQLEPAYESYVNNKYKERLKNDGNVEALADIDLMSTLDLLAQQGQWSRCLEKAKAQNNEQLLHKYIAMYAAQLFREQHGRYTVEVLNLYVTYGSPALPQNFNIYFRIATSLFAMEGLSQPDGYATWAQLRKILFTVIQSLTSSNAEDVKSKFVKLLYITHYFSVRCACKQVNTLSNMVPKISSALLRYTDIIPADKAYYEAGMDHKQSGRDLEAFVFLNHYLDICDAIDDQDDGTPLIDHSDLTATDFPSNIPLPSQLYLHNDMDKHDEAKEWVLTKIMDQKTSQALPVDDRNVYESCLKPGDVPCLITGYPVLRNRQPVTFKNSSSFLANRDAYAKFSLAAKMQPQSNVPDVLEFLEMWCGSSNYII